MITDEQIMNYSEAVDDFIAQSIVETQLSTTVVFAIILARMARISEETSSQDYFIKLIDQAKEKLIETMPVGDSIH